MTTIPDFKTIHNESECETRTDRLALRLAVRLGRPIALGCVVAIPDSNWAIRETSPIGGNFGNPKTKRLTIV